MEKKHIIILPDYSTRTQNTSENPNIPNQLQAPDTSDKGAVRKGELYNTTDFLSLGHPQGINV